MLFNVRQFGFSSWVITLVALALGLGGLATAFTAEGFHAAVVAAAVCILGFQYLSLRRARQGRLQRVRS